MSEVVDVVIVGCGAAGLSTALAFGEARPDGNAILLEAAPEAERGAATRWSTCMLRIGEDGGFDPGWLETMSEVSKGRADAGLAAALAERAPAAAALLKRSGIELHAIPRGLAATVYDQISVPEGGGAAIVDALAAQVERLPNIEIRYETPVSDLKRDGEGWLVVASGNDGPVEVRAKAVVLACGGFEGDRELLSAHVGARAAELPHIAPGLRFNTGSALKLGQSAGAATAGEMGGIHAELIDPRTTKPDAVIYSHHMGILVDGEGRRFLDEGERTFDATFEVVADRLWRHHGGHGYLVCDSSELGDPECPLHFSITTDVPPVTADTPEALEAALGLAQHTLAETIERYNAACVPGTRADFTVMDGASTRGLDPPKSNWAAPLVVPPLRAYPVRAAITFTYGGLRIDTEARALTESGEPITGLYVAGEAVGLYWHEYPGATSVLGAICTGTTAGTHAARSI